GLRRDDDVFESRQIQRRTVFTILRADRPSSLRRMPESRPMRAGAPPLCLDPGLRRDDMYLRLDKFKGARLFAILRANRPSSLRRRREPRHARMFPTLRSSDPACAGTTMYLSLAKFKGARF